MKYLLSEESGVILDSADIKTSQSVVKYVGLALDNDDNVGRKVRYIDPKCPAEKHEYTIVGRQMAWGYNECGQYVMQPAYRIACAENPFGCPAHLYQLCFVE